MQKSFLWSIAEQLLHFFAERSISCDRATPSTSAQGLGEEKREKRTVAKGAQGTSSIRASERVRTVFQYWFALHERSHSIEVCRIAKGVDQDKAIEPVPFFSQIRNTQPERNWVGVQKHGLHASGHNRLPDNRVREYRDSDASPWG